MSKKPRADLEDWEDGVATMGIGSASTLTTYDRAPGSPYREFPPGFHGANPGPSYEEAPTRKRRAPTKQVKKS